MTALGVQLFYFLLPRRKQRSGTPTINALARGCALSAACSVAKPSRARTKNGVRCRCSWTCAGLFAARARSLVCACSVAPTVDMLCSKAYSQMHLNAHVSRPPRSDQHRGRTPPPHQGVRQTACPMLSASPWQRHEHGLRIAASGPAPSPRRNADRA